MQLKTLTKLNYVYICLWIILKYLDMHQTIVNQKFIHLTNFFNFQDVLVSTDSLERLEALDLVVTTVDTAPMACLE